MGSNEKEIIVEQPLESKVFAIATKEISETLGVPFMSLFGSVLKI